MKVRIVLVTLLVFAVILTGCGKKTGTANPTTAPTTAATTAPTTAATTAPTTAATTAPTTAATQAPATTASTTPAADVVTTASIVNTEDAFLKAISTQGTWIIAITKDMTINKDLVLEGEFKNGKKDTAGNEIIQRIIALYASDANKNVTARYTLTAPKLTIKSPNASINNGKFVGDIYVDAANFQLVGQEVDGNVYFTKQEYMTSFVMDTTSKITGKKELAK
ncbi:MAG TPA: hypothetical protein VN258_08095 [Mobilitalea sp.]|nr:hypothetical protein [Mobilitalea sp.]